MPCPPFCFRFSGILLFVYHTQESFYFKVQPPTKEPIKGSYINEHYEKAITHFQCITQLISYIFISINDNFQK